MPNFRQMITSSKRILPDDLSHRTRRSGYEIRPKGFRYSQFIVTCTLAVFGLMRPLAAVHWYVPAWFLLTLEKWRVSPVPTVRAFEPLTSVHVMFGRGFPVELQNNVTSSVSLAVASWEIYSIDGGTEKSRHEYLDVTTYILFFSLLVGAKTWAALIPFVGNFPLCFWSDLTYMDPVFVLLTVGKDDQTLVRIMLTHCSGVQMFISLSLRHGCFCIAFCLRLCSTIVKWF